MYSHLPINPMPPERGRLDQLLAERGLAESRTRAASLIGQGVVTANGVALGKPGRTVAADAEITLERLDHPWVSRADVKLARALELFAVDPTGLVALDIGASTGGFAEVLRTHGAIRVYASMSGTANWRHRPRQGAPCHRLRKEFLICARRES